jgi:hypothetical protein
VHEASYNTGVGRDRITAGVKKFTLQAIGSSGWRGEATRWFEMNFAPDTWFSGPDPDDAGAGWQTHQDRNGKRYWYQDFGTQSWKDAFHGIPGSMMSVDSAFTLAAVRPQRKSFLEAYGQRLWLRQEGDTVHMNSWVIVPGGGFDKDSPYTVFSNMDLLGDSVRAFPVLTPGPPNGSPIGFRIRVQVEDATGQVDQPSETPTYPVVDPASVLDRRAINGYWALTKAGRAYAVLYAVDGNETVDRRVDHRPGGAVGIVGSASPEDRALRSKVLTFFVDHPPLLQQNAPGSSRSPARCCRVTSRPALRSTCPPPTTTRWATRSAARAPRRSCAGRSRSSERCTWRRRTRARRTLASRTPATSCPPSSCTRPRSRSRSRTGSWPATSPCACVSATAWSATCSPARRTARSPGTR